MNLLVILLLSLLGVLSPLGLGLEEVAESQIRDRLESAEELAVRIDNAPTHQLASGRIDRVRIASRGLEPLEGIYISALDVETDAVHLDLEDLDEGREALEEPLRAAVRLVITKDDIVRSLQSPRIAERLQDLNLDLLGASRAQRQRYRLVNPQVEFLPEQRIRVAVTLQEQRSPRLFPIQVELGVVVRNGHQVQLVNPSVRVSDQPVPSALLNPLVQGLNRGLDLKRLEQEGIVARVLQWQVTEEALAIAAFVQVNPESDSSGN